MSVGGKHYHKTVLFLEQTNLPAIFLEESLHCRVLVSNSPYDALLQIHANWGNIKLMILDVFFPDVVDYVFLVKFLFPFLKVVLVNARGMEYGLDGLVDDTIEENYDLQEIIDRL